MKLTFEDWKEQVIETAKAWRWMAKAIDNIDWDSFRENYYNDDYTPEQVLTLFDTNFPLERKIASWNLVTNSQLKSELIRVLCYLYLNPLSTSREIATGTKIERTSVCRVLATDEKYFDTKGEKMGKRSMVTAYSLSQDGIKHLEELNG